MTKKTKVLLLASRGAEAERIAAFARNVFSDVDAHHGDWGEPLPDKVLSWSGDLIVSYCSRWIAPERLLRRAVGDAMNFHPAPPSHPGVGGINWALYDGSDTFGVTCHQMAPRVDSGPIIEIRRFSILPSDDVSSLYERTHLQLEKLAYDILGGYALNAELPSSQEKWSGPYRSRKDLNDLSMVSNEMSVDEISRRIRATTFENWRPTTIVGGHVFELKI